jgi:hypothetical protein
MLPGENLTLPKGVGRTGFPNVLAGFETSHMEHDSMHRHPASTHTIVSGFNLSSQPKGVL